MAKNLFIAFLICVNAFLLFRAVRQNQTAAPQMVKGASSTDQTYIDKLKGKIFLQTRYRPIDVHLQSAVTGTDGASKPIKNLITDKGTFVFYFSSRHCYSCIDMAIPMLESLARKIGKENVVLLGEMENKRDVLSYKSKYNSNLAFYYVDSTVLRSEAKRMSNPFVFILDKEGKSGNPFFVESALPDITRDFFSEIEKYYASTKSE